MNHDKSITPASDILYEFSLAQELPDAELLDSFVRRVPDHADALTDLAVDMVLHAPLGEDEAIEEVQAAMEAERLEGEAR